MTKFLRTLTLCALLLTGVLAVQAGSGTGIPNPGFENGVTGWILSNIQGDKVTCQGSSKHKDHNGLCAFMFQGNASTRASIKVQAKPSFVTSANSNLAINSGGISYGAWRYSESSLTKLTIKVIIVTNTGTKIIDKSVSFGVTSSLRDTRAAEWVPVGFNKLLAKNTVITKVTLKLLDKSNAGKQWVDDAYLSFTF